MKILGANDMQHFKKQFGYRNYIQYQIGQKWGYAIPINWQKTKGETRAFIIRSQWVADCPHCYTTSIVEPTAPFFCPQCVMRDNDMLPMNLVLPAEHWAIEALLVKRLNPDNRNWLLNETIEDLKLENEKNGVK